MTNEIDGIDIAWREAVAAIACPGDWLTADERLEVWREARDAQTNPLDIERRAAVSPAAVEGSHRPTDLLAAEAVEVVHRVASDPGRLTRAWADAMIDELGEEYYTELVGVTAIVSVIDVYAAALGRPEPVLAAPEPGAPPRDRPSDVGDVGAWVAQTVDKRRANVSRTLSLVPVTNGTWLTLVDRLYSRGAQFFEPAWDRALDRTQVELIAARTTAALECFY